MTPNASMLHYSILHNSFATQSRTELSFSTLRFFIVGLSLTTTTVEWSNIFNSAVPNVYSRKNGYLTPYSPQVDAH